MIATAVERLSDRAAPGKAPGRRGRRRWTDAQKLEYVRRFRASGLKASHFCQLEGLSAVTFWSWCRRWPAKPPGAARAAGFARVEVARSSAALSHRPVVLELGEGLALAFDDRANPRWVAQLLNELRCAAR